MAGDGGSGLRRGLLALEVLALAEAEDDAGLGVVDAARRLGVDKSQASRTLRALADQGLAERDGASRAYRLGPRVFAYAALVSERRLLRAAPPVLERLVGALGERAHLSVLDGPAVLTLLSHSPPHAVQAAGWAGRSVPALLHGRRPRAAGRPRAGGAARAARRRRAGRRGPNTVASLGGARGARAGDRPARLRGRGRGAGARTRRGRGSGAPLRRPHRRCAERVRAFVPLSRPAPSGRRRGRASRRGAVVAARRSTPLQATQREL